MSQQQQFQRCEKCGAVKLQFIDFTLNTPNRNVCCYCDNIPPTQCINANMFLPSQNKTYPWSVTETRELKPEPIEIQKPIDTPKGKIWIDWSDVIGYEKIKI